MTNKCVNVLKFEKEFDWNKSNACTVEVREIVFEENVLAASNRRLCVVAFTPLIVPGYLSRVSLVIISPDQLILLR